MSGTSPLAQNGKIIETQGPLNLFSTALNWNGASLATGGLGPISGTLTVTSTGVIDIQSGGALQWDGPSSQSPIGDSHQIKSFEYFDQGAVQATATTTQSGGTGFPMLCQVTAFRINKFIHLNIQQTISTNTFTPNPATTLTIANTVLPSTMRPFSTVTANLINFETQSNGHVINAVMTIGTDGTITFSKCFNWDSAPGTFDSGTSYQFNGANISYYST